MSKRGVARKIASQTDELIKTLIKNPINILDVVSQAREHIRGLSYDAKLAFLDGRVARSKAP